MDTGGDDGGGGKCTASGVVLSVPAQPNSVQDGCEAGNPPSLFCLNSFADKFRAECSTSSNNNDGGCSQTQSRCGSLVRATGCNRRSRGAPLQQSPCGYFYCSSVFNTSGFKSTFRPTGLRSGVNGYVSINPKLRGIGRKISSNTLHGVESVNDLRSWSVSQDDRRRYFVDQMRVLGHESSEDDGYGQVVIERPRPKKYDDLRETAPPEHLLAEDTIPLVEKALSAVQGKIASMLEAGPASQHNVESVESTRRPKVEPSSQLRQPTIEPSNSSRQPKIEASSSKAGPNEKVAVKPLQSEAPSRSESRPGPGPVESKKGSKVGRRVMGLDRDESTTSAGGENPSLSEYKSATRGPSLSRQKSTQILLKSAGPTSVLSYTEQSQVRVVGGGAKKTQPATTQTPPVALANLVDAMDDVEKEKLFRELSKAENVGGAKGGFSRGDCEEERARIKELLDRIEELERQQAEEVTLPLDTSTSGQAQSGRGEETRPDNYSAGETPVPTVDPLLLAELRRIHAQINQDPNTIRNLTNPQLEIIRRAVQLLVDNNQAPPNNESGRAPTASASATTPPPPPAAAPAKSQSDVSGEFSFMVETTTDFSVDGEGGLRLVGAQETIIPPPVQASPEENRDGNRPDRNVGSAPSVSPSIFPGPGIEPRPGSLSGSRQLGDGTGPVPGGVAAGGDDSLPLTRPTTAAPSEYPLQRQGSAGARAGDAVEVTAAKPMGRSAVPASAPSRIPVADDGAKSRGQNTPGKVPAAGGAEKSASSLRCQQRGREEQLTYELDQHRIEIANLQRQIQQMQREPCINVQGEPGTGSGGQKDVSGSSGPNLEAIANTNRDLINGVENVSQLLNRSDSKACTAAAESQRKDVLNEARSHISSSPLNLTSLEQDRHNLTAEIQKLEKRVNQETTRLDPNARAEARKLVEGLINEARNNNNLSIGVPPPTNYRDDLHSTWPLSRDVPEGPLGPVPGRNLPETQPLGRSWDDLAARNRELISRLEDLSQLLNESVPEAHGPADRANVQQLVAEARSHISANAVQEASPDNAAVVLDQDSHRLTAEIQRLHRRIDQGNYRMDPNARDQIARLAAQFMWIEAIDHGPNQPVRDGLNQSFPLASGRAVGDAARNFIQRSSSLEALANRNRRLINGIEGISQLLYASDPALLTEETARTSAQIMADARANLSSDLFESRGPENSAAVLEQDRRRLNVELGTMEELVNRRTARMDPNTRNEAQRMIREVRGNEAPLNQTYVVEGPGQPGTGQPDAANTSAGQSQGQSRYVPSPTRGGAGAPALSQSYAPLNSTAIANNSANRSGLNQDALDRDNINGMQNYRNLKSTEGDRPPSGNIPDHRSRPELGIVTRREPTVAEDPGNASSSGNNNNDSQSRQAAPIAQADGTYDYLDQNIFGMNEYRNVREAAENGDPPRGALQEHPPAPVQYNLATGPRPGRENVYNNNNNQSGQAAPNPNSSGVNSERPPSSGIPPNSANISAIEGSGQRVFASPARGNPADQSDGPWQSSVYGMRVSAIEEGHTFEFLDQNIYGMNEYRNLEVVMDEGPPSGNIPEHRRGPTEAMIDRRQGPEDPYSALERLTTATQQSYNDSNMSDRPPPAYLALLNSSNNGDNRQIFRAPPENGGNVPSSNVTQSRHSRTTPPASSGLQGVPTCCREITGKKLNVSRSLPANRSAPKSNQGSVCVQQGPSGSGIGGQRDVAGASGQNLEALVNSNRQLISGVQNISRLLDATNPEVLNPAERSNLDQVVNDARSHISEDLIQWNTPENSVPVLVQDQRRLTAEIRRLENRINQRNYFVDPNARDQMARLIAQLQWLEVIDNGSSRPAPTGLNRSYPLARGQTVVDPGQNGQQTRRSLGDLVNMTRELISGLDDLSQSLSLDPSERSNLEQVVNETQAHISEDLIQWNTPDNTAAVLDQDRRNLTAVIRRIEERVNQGNVPVDPRARDRLARLIAQLQWLEVIENGYSRPAPTGLNQSFPRTQGRNVQRPEWSLDNMSYVNSQLSSGLEDLSQYLNDSIPGSLDPAELSSIQQVVNDARSHISEDLIQWTTPQNAVAVLDQDRRRLTAEIQRLHQRLDQGNYRVDPVARDQIGRLAAQLLWIEAIDHGPNQPARDGLNQSFPLASGRAVGGAAGNLPQRSNSLEALANRNRRLINGIEGISQLLYASDPALFNQTPRSWEQAVSDARSHLDDPRAPGNAAAPVLEQDRRRLNAEVATLQQLVNQFSARRNPNTGDEAQRILRELHREDPLNQTYVVGGEGQGQPPPPTQANTSGGQSQGQARYVPSPTRGGTGRPALDQSYAPLNSTAIGNNGGNNDAALENQGNASSSGNNNNQSRQAAPTAQADGTYGYLDQNIFGMNEYRNLKEAAESDDPPRGALQEHPPAPVQYNLATGPRPGRESVYSSSNNNQSGQAPPNTSNGPAQDVNCERPPSTGPPPSGANVSGAQVGGTGQPVEYLSDNINGMQNYRDLEHVMNEGPPPGTIPEHDRAPFFGLVHWRGNDAPEHQGNVSNSTNNQSRQAAPTAGVSAAGQDGNCERPQSGALPPNNQTANISAIEGPGQRIFASPARPGNPADQSAGPWHSSVYGMRVSGVEDGRTFEFLDQNVMGMNEYRNLKALQNEGPPSTNIPEHRRGPMERMIDRRGRPANPYSGYRDLPTFTQQQNVTNPNMPELPPPAYLGLLNSYQGDGRPIFRSTTQNPDGQNSGAEACTNPNNDTSNRVIPQQQQPPDPNQAATLVNWDEDVNGIQNYGANPFASFQQPPNQNVNCVNPNNVNIVQNDSNGCNRVGNENIDLNPQLQQQQGPGPRANINIRLRLHQDEIPQQPPPQPAPPLNSTYNVNPMQNYGAASQMQNQVGNPNLVCYNPGNSMNDGQQEVPYESALSPILPPNVGNGGGSQHFFATPPRNSGDGFNDSYNPLQSTRFDVRHNIYVHPDDPSYYSDYVTPEIPPMIMRPLPDAGSGFPGLTDSSQLSNSLNNSSQPGAGGAGGGFGQTYTRH